MFGLIIVSSKSYDLEASIKDFAPGMGPDSRVLPLLNGMRHLDQLDAHFGAQRVLGGVARISSTLDADGGIHQLGTFNALAFGARGAGIDIGEIADGLRVPGFEAHLSGNIVLEMWEKWVFIAAAASTTSLMRASVGDILAADARDIPVQLLQECAAIAAEHGFAPREAANQGSVGGAYRARFRLHRIDVARHRAGRPHRGRSHCRRPSWTRAEDVALAAARHGLRAPARL